MKAHQRTLCRVWKKHGLRVPPAARKLGVSECAVHYWLSGKRQMSASNALKMWRYLLPWEPGLTLEALLK